MPPSQPEAENKALVRDLLTGIWINQDIRVVDDLVAEDVVVTNVSFGVELHGVDQFKETLEMALAGFSDIDISTHRVLAEDDAVVAHWTVEGTHGGPFMGVEPTNKRVEWTNVSFLPVARAGSRHIGRFRMPLGSCGKLGRSPSGPTIKRGP